jgi:hypothetical protein
MAAASTRGFLLSDLTGILKLYREYNVSFIPLTTQSFNERPL